MLYEQDSATLAANPSWPNQVGLRECLSRTSTGAIDREVDAPPSRLWRDKALGILRVNEGLELVAQTISSRDQLSVVAVCDSLRSEGHNPAVERVIDSLVEVFCGYRVAQNNRPISAATPMTRQRRLDDSRKGHRCSFADVERDAEGAGVKHGVKCGLTSRVQARGRNDVNREAELDRPSRVAGRDLLAVMVEPLHIPNWNRATVVNLDIIRDNISRRMRGTPTLLKQLDALVQRPDIINSYVIHWVILRDQDHLCAAKSTSDASESGGVNLLQLVHHGKTAPTTNTAHSRNALTENDRKPSGPMIAQTIVLWRIMPELGRPPFGGV